MLHGHNVIGFEASAKGHETFQSFSTIQGSFLQEKFHIATNDEIEAAIAKAVTAFGVYSKVPL